MHFPHTQAARLLPALGEEVFAPGGGGTQAALHKAPVQNKEAEN